jgi:hypothetical protein
LIGGRCTRGNPLSQAVLMTEGFPQLTTRLLALASVRFEGRSGETQRRSESARERLGARSQTGKVKKVRQETALQIGWQIGRGSGKIKPVGPSMPEHLNKHLNEHLNEHLNK